MDRFHSTSIEALQHLFEYIDELNPEATTMPTLETMLHFTHELSGDLSELLDNLVRALAGGEEALTKRLPTAVEQTANAITTLKRMMLTLHHLRRAASARAGNP